MSIKSQLFEQLAKVAQCLASPQRVMIMDFVVQAERSVDELSGLTQMSVANVSRHLQILKQNGLVQMRKQAKNRFYRVSGDDVVDLIASLRQTAEGHLAEAQQLKQQLLEQESSMPQQTLSSELLWQKMQQQTIATLDVRPEKEFLAGHIQGAIHIEPDEMAAALDKVPSDQEVAVYCRGAYCAFSYQMVDQLLKNGVQAYRLEEGFPDWKAAGLPCELAE